MTQLEVAIHPTLVMDTAMDLATHLIITLTKEIAARLLSTINTATMMTANAIVSLRESNTKRLVCLTILLVEVVDFHHRHQRLLLLLIPDLYHVPTLLRKRYCLHLEVHLEIKSAHQAPHAMKLSLVMDIAMETATHRLITMTKEIAA